jgi:GNAT superfamily N-acetyltransferase
MTGMTLTAECVAAASAAWVWVPDNAIVIQTDEYTILRMPDYFEFQLAVSTFEPAGPLGAAVDRVLGRAREFGLPEVLWQARLEDPAGLGPELEARGGHVELVLDVLACDLTTGRPALPPPAADVTIRWATDFETARDASVVQVAAFGGELPPDDRIEVNAGRDAASVAAGEGGMLVAYVAGGPAGAGGVTVADGGVARLWGGSVVPAARGLGVYRAVLDERLGYAVSNGSTMALVKGKADTSGPILRRAGFAAFGQEPQYRVPL